MSELLSRVNPRRVMLALALLAYARNTGCNLRQQHILLQQNDPRLPWLEHIQAALKYTTTGQLIASSEYLLCLVKPQLAARIGRLLAWTPQNCRVNCRYGPHERNTLDVYGVEEGEGASAKPVLVFMHGGAWSFGYKWQYALVGEYLATQGFLVAVINYRTFPTGSVVDMIEDVENAVFWVAENCQSLGGDSSRLFLSGHSSGGHVGALALVNSAIRLVVDDPKEKEIANYVRGFIGLSAPYDISDHYIFESERVVGPLNGVHEISSMKPAMLGMGNFTKYSPTALVAKAKNLAFSLPQFHILHGKDDTVVPTSSSKKFALNLKQSGQAATYYEVSNCTHEDMVFAVMGDNVECRTDVVKLLKRIMLEPDNHEASSALPLGSPILTSPPSLASKL